MMVSYLFLFKTKCVVATNIAENKVAIEESHIISNVAMSKEEPKAPAGTAASIMMQKSIEVEAREQAL